MLLWKNVQHKDRVMNYTQSWSCLEDAHLSGLTVGSLDAMRHAIGAPNLEKDVQVQSAFWEP